MPSAEESLILLGSDPGAVQWDVVGEEGGVPFENDWTTPDDWFGVPSGLAAPHYRKVKQLVFLEGGAGGGEAGQPIFVLPENFRPQQLSVFIVPLVTQNVSNVNGFAHLAIAPTGQIAVINAWQIDSTDGFAVSTPATGDFGVNLHGVFFTTTYGA